MLTVFTSTCCRPDYVQLLASALRATAREPYRFVVVVHPRGLRRDWDGVDEVIDGKAAGYVAWKDIRPMITGPSVIMHDDCVPVLPWSRGIFPSPHCARIAGHTLYYHAGPPQPAAPAISAVRVADPTDCPSGWSDELCLAALASHAERMLDGTFLHIDKGTIAKPDCPANAAKPRLVQAICDFLGISLPEPLTAAEAALHPGKFFPSMVRPGLGDLVKSGLSAVGITEERVSKLIGRPCGCGARAEALNRLGAKLGIGGKHP
jgi:hypothetical protein